ncbi:hypothetical protein BDF21DRAFT_413374 [Thamnidium elegans]|nr:hypothetical protein BDF21DRAFT_413374 [Thamnidium elegans]
MSLIKKTIINIFFFTSFCSTHLSSYHAIFFVRHNLCLDRCPTLFFFNSSFFLKKKPLPRSLHLCLPNEYKTKSLFECLPSKKRKKQQQKNGNAVLMQNAEYGKVNNIQCSRYQFAGL